MRGQKGQEKLFDGGKIEKREITLHIAKKTEERETGLLLWSQCPKSKFKGLVKKTQKKERNEKRHQGLNTIFQSTKEGKKGKKRGSAI